MRTTVAMPGKRDRYAWKNVEVKPHWVYRCFDQYARLCYVGCTCDIDSRLQWHADNAWWAPQIKWVEIERWATRAEGRKAEREAILNEHPRWNIEYKRGREADLPLQSVLDYSEALRRAVGGQPRYEAVLRHLAGAE